MRPLLLFVLLLCCGAASASDAERKPRKKNRKPDTEQVVRPETPAPEAQPAPASPEPPAARPETPAVNDVTLGYTAEQTDSLLSVWREQLQSDAYNDFVERYLDADSLLLDSLPTPMLDTLYASRLQALVSPVPLAYNAIVKSRIELYVKKNPALTGRILGMSQYYFPFIEEELLKAGLPVELRAMAVIESALIPTAASRAGAVGLWQFMPPTGKGYGLEINSLVDERRDPIRSTQAAVRYLKDLYSLYGDWTLAIAAYNCGPGNINKAIARSGLQQRRHSFWDIYDYLPSETRGYVPAFIGATYAYAYHRQHDINLDETPIPIAVDTIRVNRLLHFGQIASTIDLPIETLRLLNPQYKIDIIPATTKTYTLVLPQRNVAQYIASEKEIFAKDSLYLKEYLNPVNIEKKRAEGVVHSRTYVVKKGDTLGAIARRYRVSVKQLMKWNKIHNANALRVGRRLRVG